MPNKQINIIFFGNTNFSNPTLLACNKNFNLKAVVTNKSKKMGRGQKILDTPVMTLAKEKSFKVIEGEDLNDKSFINELKNLNLKFGIEEGDISFSDSTINWKDDLKLTLVESLLDFENGQIYLSGKINLKFYDLQNFYKTFQIKRDIRKDVNNIELDFVYNFDQKKISFDNVKLDDKSNTKLENYINRFNLNDRKILNKVTFKNFVNNFFEAYAG